MKMKLFFNGHRTIWLILMVVLATLLLTAATSEAAPEQSCGFYHVVERGQTLSQISRQYGVPIAELMRANPQIKNPDKIYAGSRILIPCQGGTGGQCRFVHQVKYGDTLTTIAWRYHVSPYAIMRVNHIQNPNLIFAGTSLCVP